MEADAREGGTGTRAKGEDGKSRAALGGSHALARPSQGFGAGRGRLGGIGAHGSGVLRPAAPSRNFDTEAYAPVVDNALLSAKEHPLSTFSADVDTASFSNARRFLREGSLPPKDSIRVEEWLNYFSYPYPAPAGDAPVAIHTEVSSCPWAPEHRLVRIGIKARPITEETTPARNLVFLVDVSGSTTTPSKLPLLKSGLGMLARTLRPKDSVAIVAYAGASGLVLDATSGEQQDRILDALAALEAGGAGAQRALDDLRQLRQRKEDSLEAPADSGLTTSGLTTSGGGT
jgi:Ca-activated chloride channel family protein